MGTTDTATPPAPPDRTLVLAQLLEAVGYWQHYRDDTNDRDRTERWRQALDRLLDQLLLTRS